MAFFAGLETATGEALEDAPGSSDSDAAAADADTGPLDTDFRAGSDEEEEIAALLARFPTERRSAGSAGRGPTAPFLYEDGGAARMPQPGVPAFLPAAEDNQRGFPQAPPPFPPAHLLQQGPVAGQQAAPWPQQMPPIFAQQGQFFPPGAVPGQGQGAPWFATNFNPGSAGGGPLPPMPAGAPTSAQIQAMMYAQAQARAQAGQVSQHRPITQAEAGYLAQLGRGATGPSIGPAARPVGSPAPAPAPLPGHEAGPATSASSSQATAAKDLSRLPRGESNGDKPRSSSSSSKSETSDPSSGRSKGSVQYDRIEYRPRWQQNRARMRAREIDSMVRLTEQPLFQGNLYVEDYYFQVMKKRREEAAYADRSGDEAALPAVFGRLHKPLFESAQRRARRNQDRESPKEDEGAPADSSANQQPAAAKKGKTGKTVPKQSAKKAAKKAAKATTAAADEEQAIETVLGRFSLSSARNPRPLLQIVRPDRPAAEAPDQGSDQTRPSHSKKKAAKLARGHINTLSGALDDAKKLEHLLYAPLLRIEQAFGAVLEIEDIDMLLERSRISERDAARVDEAALETQRSHLVEELFSKTLRVHVTPFSELPQRTDDRIYLFAEDEPFISTLLMRKGRALVSRLLPLMVPSQILSVFFACLRNAALLSMQVSGQDSHSDTSSDPLFDVLSLVVKGGGAPHTILALQTLLAAHADEHILAILQTAPGSSLVRALLKKGHDLSLSLFSREDPALAQLSEEVRSQRQGFGLPWRDTISSLMDRMEGHWATLCSVPGASTSSRTWELLAVLVVNLNPRYRLELLAELSDVIATAPDSPILSAFLQLAGVTR